MAELGEVISNVGPTAGGIGNVIIWVTIGFVFLMIIGGLVFYFAYQRRKWNLKVEFKLPRSDGKIINGEWGKGFYDSKRGVVYVKRAGAKPIPIKIFDVRKYMQGTDLITVLQLSADDYRPILNDSWTEYVEDYYDEDKPILDDNGKPVLDSEGNPTYEVVQIKDSILNIKTDTGKNKAWRTAYEEAAKNAFTITSLLRQFQTPIAIGIVVICCFVGFAILWTKLSSVCS